MSASAGLRVELQAALADYRFLVERGYSSRPSIELVGNRYRLSREERNMLFRGVVDRERGGARRRRLIGETELRASGALLRVDGYNVLYAIVAYLRGVPVFLCTDGLLRDVGAAHGRGPPVKVLRRSAELLGSALRELRPHGAAVLFDTQVKLSGEAIAVLKHGLAGGGVIEELRFTPSVDAELIESRPPVVLAGSDSVVLDRTEVPVFDLARFSLERAFHPTWLDLEAASGEPDESGPDESGKDAVWS